MWTEVLDVLKSVQKINAKVIPMHVEKARVISGFGMAVAA